MKKAFIQLHVAVLLAGLTGILGKLITLNEGLLVWYRLLITAISLWILALFTRQQIRIPAREIGRIVVVGFLAALHWVFFYGSIKYSNVSVALLCFSSIGFFTAILEPLIFRRRIDLIELLLGLLVIFGILLIFQVDPGYKIGIGIGLVSSFLGALFPVMNRSLVQRIPAGTVTLYELSGGFVFMSILLPVYLHFFPTTHTVPSHAEWGWLLVLSWLCTVVAFNLSMSALKHISAFTVNLTYNLEPVYGILLAFLVFREERHINTGFAVGGALIILSIILQMIRLGKLRARARKEKETGLPG